MAPTRRIEVLDDPDMLGSLPLVRSARIVGAFVYIEEQVFAIAGAWSGAAPLLDGDVEVATPPLTPSQAVWSSTLSLHAAWRAGQWRLRLPFLREMPPALLVASPGQHVDEALDLLRSADPSDGLAGLAECVLPSLRSTYEMVGARWRPVADAEVVRTTRRIAADLADDLAERPAGAMGGAPDGLERLVSAPLVSLDIEVEPYV